MDLAAALNKRFRCSEKTNDIQRVVAYQRQAVVLCPVWNTRHSTFVGGLGSLLYTQFGQVGDMEDLNEAIECGRRVLDLLPRGHANHPKALNNLAAYIHTRFKQRGNAEDIDEAIQLHREALVLLAAPHPDRGRCLSNLANIIHTQFKLRGNAEDIDEALGLHREALTLCPAPHPDRGSSLSNLSNTIYTRFKQRGNAEDIDEAVELHREALALCPAFLNNLGSRGNAEDIDEALELHREALALRPAPHPDRGIFLNNLAGRGNADDIDEAIGLNREALALHPAPHSDRGISLNNLAIILHERFEQQGNAKDIDEAIGLHREALALHPAPHPDRGSSLCNLANIICARFEQRGNADDIDEAIGLHREALTLHPTPHPDRGGSLSGLATTIYARFEQQGNAEDIDEAIGLHREALTLRPAPHPDRGNSFGGLATTIYARFEQQGNAEDIDEALRLNREALALCPAPHPERGISLNNLAGIIHARFKQRGNSEDIDEAIELNREALALCPALNPGRGRLLTNLASVIYARFKQRGNSEDIDEAIGLNREALALHPAPHPDRGGFLNNLAGVIHARFEQRRNVDDIDEAIGLHREALALRPAPHPDRGISLNNLADVIHARFKQRGNAEDIDEAVGLNREALALHVIYARFKQRGNSEDIDEAIGLNREALALCPALHPGRGIFLNNLAGVIHARFEQQGNAEDIDEAIGLHREVLVLLAAPHLDRGISLNNLAIILHERFEQQGNAEDLNEAMQAFVEARFLVAKDWAQKASLNHHTSAMHAYQVTIEMLPQLAAFNLDLQSRQKLLSRSYDVGSDAAACAIALGQYELAIELLEAGRSVLWSQSLHLRTSVDDLQLSHPHLATKLAELSWELERSSFRDTSRNFQSDSHHKVMSMEAEGLKCLQLNNEWVQTVESIRLLPGFEDFMRPRRISTLRHAAAQGPVVVLNAGSESCHALIVHSSGKVQCIPLPEMSTRDSAKLLAEIVHAISSPITTFNSFLTTLSERGFNSYSIDRLIGKLVYEKNQSPTDRFHHLLASLWTGIAIPVFQCLSLQKSDTPPRLWWCPTGAFAFLPIHAAGIYTEGSMQEATADYVISSYTPTLTALLSSHPTFGPTNPLRAAVVIQPTTTHFADLPNTIDELRKIEETIPKEWLTSLESPASVDMVLQLLQSSSIIHFACHGVQNTGEPLQSAVLVGNDKLTVLQIMEKSGVSHSGSSNPKNLGLAFLSACETAMGDKNVPDEAMHLAATLLFAGFRSVVATMWTIKDPDCPEIAEVFYSHLFRNADPTSSLPVFPDISESAEALHLAVKKLRTKVPLLQWIPFVHYGK
ncbi:tetratricopeptide repeat-containing protein [Mycena leptocephala]|nr:tetratricopeptide repeat-containing protein [Mycena leptocephala]